MKRILSGITPSSTKGLHLGNYLGAVKRFVEMQRDGECFYFVANLHALNTVFSPTEIAENTNNIFLEYLAFGVDPTKTTFYVESDIPEIPYLQTILNNCVTVAELQRMHGYKDKMAKEADQSAINVGLFNYPVLMAADILVFAPDIVPVGEDQTQHVEICREIARTFNNRYGDVLKVPELSVQKETARVIGIDGVRKMSKSLGNDLPVFASEKEIYAQVMKITTDPARIRPTDPGDPAKNICFSYLRLLSLPEREVVAMEERYRSGTIGDVEIKKHVYELFLSVMRPFREKKAELQKDLGSVQKVRIDGKERARAVAKERIDAVMRAVGFAI
ncbi:MAG: tryptophan--tRNA ligase [Candidatus Roizmanbacteria bacterium]